MPGVVSVNTDEHGFILSSKGQDPTRRSVKLSSEIAWQNHFMRILALVGPIILKKN